MVWVLHAPIPYLRELKYHVNMSRPRIDNEADKLGEFAEKYKKKLDPNNWKDGEYYEKLNELMENWKINAKDPMHMPICENLGERIWNSRGFRVAALMRVFICTSIFLSVEPWSRSINEEVKITFYVFFGVSASVILCLCYYIQFQHTAEESKEDSASPDLHVKIEKKHKNVREMYWKTKYDPKATKEQLKAAEYEYQYSLFEIENDIYSGHVPGSHNIRGETVFTLACRLKMHEVVALLLRTGYNPNTHDFLGNTPLCIAIMCYDQKTINVLLNEKRTLQWTLCLTNFDGTIKELEFAIANATYLSQDAVSAKIKPNDHCCSLSSISKCFRLPTHCKNEKKKFKNGDTVYRKASPGNKKLQHGTIVGPCEQDGNWNVKFDNGSIWSESGLLLEKCQSYLVTITTYDPEHLEKETIPYDGLCLCCQIEKFLCDSNESENNLIVKCENALQNEEAVSFDLKIRNMQSSENTLRFVRHAVAKGIKIHESAIERDVHLDIKQEDAECFTCTVYAIGESKFPINQCFKCRLIKSLMQNKNLGTIPKVINEIVISHEHPPWYSLYQFEWFKSFSKWCRVKRAVDVNEVCKTAGNGEKKDEASPLMCCALRCSKSVDLVRQLIKMGADMKYTYMSEDNRKMSFLTVLFYNSNCNTEYKIEFGNALIDDLANMKVMSPADRDELYCEYQETIARPEHQQGPVSERAIVQKDGFHNAIIEIQPNQSDEEDSSEENQTAAARNWPDSSNIEQFPNDLTDQRMLRCVRCNVDYQTDQFKDPGSPKCGKCQNILRSPPLQPASMFEHRTDEVSGIYLSPRKHPEQFLSPPPVEAHSDDEEDENEVPDVAQSPKRSR